MQCNSSKRDELDAIQYRLILSSWILEPVDWCCQQNILIASSNIPKKQHRHVKLMMSPVMETMEHFDDV